MNKKSINWITFTAMGIGLIIVIQSIGQYIPDMLTIFGPFSLKQLIIGSLVNTTLLVFTWKSGLTSGITIGIISAFLAAVLGMSQMVIAPAVAIGNALICVVYHFLVNKSNHYIAVVLGAIVKCGFLWVVVPMLLETSGLPAPAVSKLSIMMSWPQGITALCGGLLSKPVIDRFK